MRHFNLGFVESYDGADNPEAWARASNLDLADRLAGELLLMACRRGRARPATTIGSALTGSYLQPYIQPFSSLWP